MALNYRPALLQFLSKPLLRNRLYRHWKPARIRLMSLYLRRSSGKSWLDSTSTWTTSHSRRRPSSRSALHCCCHLEVNIPKSDSQDQRTWIGRSQTSEVQCTVPADRSTNRRRLRHHHVPLLPVSTTKRPNTNASTFQQQSERSTSLHI